MSAKAAFTVIGRGSSKNLIKSSALPAHIGFEFSDRISVFDYGALPDAIPAKGKSLERAALVFFRELHAARIATAFDAVATKEQGKIFLHAAQHPRFPVEGLKSNLEFIPLEIIFRWGVSPGSSLLKRRQDLVPYARFDAPLIEFSTKLEPFDRMLDEAEATDLAGSAKNLAKVKIYADRVAHCLRDYLKSCGLELWDGKIECAIDKTSGEILMIDALTPDEIRVSIPGLDGIPLSKELLRMWLGATDWAFSVARAKAQGGADWKKTLSAPPKLGAWRLKKISSLYEAFAESMEAKTSRALLAWVRADDFPPKVFVVGSGGREAALKWKLKSEGCEISDSPAEADTVWVSPDAELAEGQVDAFEAKGFWTYGPQKESAKIEWSKGFGREIAQEAGIRVPRYTDRAGDLKTFKNPPVVKLDGLAAGKGVIVPHTFAEAEAAWRTLGSRGKVLLEEQLHGFEASAFFAVESGFHGVKTKFLGCAKDFKRRFPGDEGPNTGGMGSYAPHPDIKEDDLSIFSEWAQKTAQVLFKRGLPYNGILYLGLMKDENTGWNLIEYNARFGDPETQALSHIWPLQPILRSLLQLDLKHPSSYELGTDEHAMCVALVRPEYPNSVSGEIDLPNWDFKRDDVHIFRTSSTKGRVAYVVARGATLQMAGDMIFETLIESPWRDILEWRPDILK